MVIRLKDTAKLFGITIIACCAVFVCTLFLSYNIDLAAIKDEIVTEAGTEMYNAQVLMGNRLKTKFLLIQLIIFSSSGLSLLLYLIQLLC